MALSLGVLSWGAHKTLRNSLKTYEASGMLDMLSEKYIFFQDISDDDLAIASEFGYTAYGAATNLGISEGFKALVEKASCDNFLFLENDWSNNQDKAKTWGELINAQFALMAVDVVRLRSRFQPGSPLWTRQFQGHEYDKPTHLLDAVYWCDPDHFPEIEKRGSFWVTTAKNANWTNNPFIAKTQWLKDNIVPRLAGDIEKSIQGWWQQQDFKVAQGEGLFTHNRLD